LASKECSFKDKKSWQFSIDPDTLVQPFDPNNIMNPGGTLRLYMNPAQREKCLD